MFAVHTWQGNDGTGPRRFDTIRAKISHVLWCHQIGAGFRPCLLPEHELALKRMQRVSPPRRERTAATFEMLEAIFNAADLSCTHHRVICGAAVLGFYFCLRGAEYLSSSSMRHGYCLQVNDVSVVDERGQTATRFEKAVAVTITLRGSKTDQSGKTTARTLQKSGQAPICPVFAALLLLRNAASLRLPSNKPICSTGLDHMITAESMTKVLKKAAAACGVDPSLISAHSLRVGGATALHAAGMTADTIWMHGRWASDAYQVYLRQNDASSMQLAQQMSARRGNIISNSSPR